MTPEEFIAGIDVAVKKASVSSMRSNLSQLSGRNPEPKLVEASTWFKQLPESQQRIVMHVVEWSVFYAVILFLEAIDGNNVVEWGDEKGDFELYYVKGGERILLNDPAKYGPLHQMLGFD